MTNSNNSCPLSEICGGCSLRNLPLEEYRSRKTEKVKAILSGINLPEVNYGDSVFIGDRMRRRATMAFRCKKGVVTLGFNAAQIGRAHV